MVEAGFTRAKNAINIMMKNLMDFSIGSIAFWAIGFGIMFGATSTGGFGTSGFFLSDFSPGGDPWVLAFWMFQVVFAATAASKDIAMIFVNTNLAAAAGAVVAMFVSWFRFGKPEVLDFIEHGGSAYPDFVEVSSYGGMSSGGPSGGSMERQPIGLMGASKQVPAT